MTVSIGLVGAGNISETHARTAQSIPGVEIAAVYGANQEKAAALAAKVGAAVYHDFSRFLKHRPMEMGAIGSPSGLHAEQAIAAARCGLHVLIEKPVDISVERVDALLDETGTCRRLFPGSLAAGRTRDHGGCRPRVRGWRARRARSGYVNRSRIRATTRAHRFQGTLILENDRG